MVECGVLEPATYRILVVDDHPDAAEMICMMLRSFGHTCASAVTGEEGLVRARELGPDIAFLDIGLPDMSGFELARRIRATHGKQIFLVAITGWTAVEDRDRARQAGFDRHVVKPLNGSVLRELLAEAATLRS